MHRLTVFTATLASGAVLAAPASASIVKAPVGASSKLKLNASTTKTLKKQRVTVSSSGSAKRTGATLSLPYSLARWDFDAREGDVAHFRKNTGLRFKRGARSIAMVHPRVILDGDDGYITALISNIRVKTFTFRLSSGTVTNTADLQRISGLKLKLTKASAVYLNQGLRRRVLRPYVQFATLELNLRRPVGPVPGSPGSGSGGGATGGGNSGTGGTGTGGTGTTPPVTGAPGRSTNNGATATLGSGFVGGLPIGGAVAPMAPGVAADTNGDGQPEAGVFALPLQSSTFNATTRTGTIALQGGLIVRANGQDVVALRDPEIVVGATPADSGLFALVNGVRVKVGTIDPGAIAVSALNGTVTVSDLDVRVAPGLTLPGLTLVPGAPLLSLDVSVSAA